jgi:hypothetical protein
VQPHRGPHFRTQSKGAGAEEPAPSCSCIPAGKGDEDFTGGMPSSWQARLLKADANQPVNTIVAFMTLLAVADWLFMAQLSHFPPESRREAAGRA